VRCARRARISDLAPRGAAFDDTGFLARLKLGSYSMVNTRFRNMTQAEIEGFIIGRWKQRARDRGIDLVVVDRSTDLMEASGGMDSLDLAVLVGELEQHTGKDPFAGSVPEFRTVTDLARLYAD
jgi:acyl carrier protein